MKNSVFSFLFVLLIGLVSLSHAQSFPENYSEAMRAMDTKEFGKAFTLFENFFGEKQLSEQFYSGAKLNSAYSLKKVGVLEGAAVSYEYFINRFEYSANRPQAIYNLGLLYYSIGEYTKSKNRFLMITNEYPESPLYARSLYWIGQNFIAEGRIDFAISFLEEAVNKPKSNKYIDYTIYSLAVAYEKNNDFRNAVRYYERLLSFHSDSELAPSAQVRIGICYFRLGEYNNAAIELSSPDVMRLSRDDQAEAMFLLANSYYKTADYTLAVQNYDRVLKEYPGTVVVDEARYGLGWSYFQLKDYPAAFNVFDFLSSSSNDSLAEQSFFWKAEAKRYNGEDKVALGFFRAFLELYPSSQLAKTANYNIGIIQFNLKQYDQASKSLESAAGSDDNDTRARSFTLLGEVSLTQKKYAPAKSYFSQALGLQNVSPDISNRATLGSGVASYFLTKYKESINLLQELQKLYPDFESDKVSFYLAESYFEDSNYAASLAQYRKVSAANTELSLLALYGKAYSYYNLRDYDNARFAFKDYLQRDPSSDKSIDVRIRMADSYFAVKDFKEAEEGYRQALSFRNKVSNSDYIVYQYALSLFNSGNSDAAIDELTKLVNLYPRSQYIDNSRYMIGWIFFKKGEYQAAITSYNNVLNSTPGTPLRPIIYYSIGDAYYNLGNYTEAIAQYQLILNQFPNSPQVYDAVNGLQYCYLATGNTEEAVKVLDTYARANSDKSFADELFFKIGELYYSVGEYVKAKTYYADFTAKYPSSELIAAAYYWYAKSSANLNQNEDALRAYRIVVENYINNDFGPSAAAEAGTLQSKLGNFDAAISFYDLGISKLGNSPRVAELKYLKGMAFKSKNDHGAAYDLFDDVILYYANTVFGDMAKLEKGVIEFEAKRYDAALGYFRDVVSKRNDENAARAQYMIGEVFFKQSKLNDALTAYTRGLNTFPNFQEWVLRSHLRIGMIYEQQGDKNKARESYRVIIATDKNSSVGKEAQQRLNKIR